MLTTRVRQRRTRLLAHASIWLISRYRAHRLVENACRFVPSCSEYALIAVDRFGVWGGLVLTLKRLLRCRLPHGGYDPVPHQEGDSYAGV